MSVDIFLITSVIKTGNKPWTYAQRSAFTEDERYTQTLETIRSIRQYHPTAKIMLVECSHLKKEYETDLQSKVDIFLQLVNIKSVYDSCFNTDRKGYGEAMQTREGVKYLLNNNIEFERIFKICGRYRLTDGFNPDNYPYDKFGFRHIQGTTHVTILYSVPRVLIAEFMKALLISISTYHQKAISLEDILPSNCEPKVLMEKLGVTGNVGPFQNSIADF